MRIRVSSIRVVAVAFCAVAAFAAPSARAVSIYDSGGFDSLTRFPAGPLEGKDGGLWQRSFGGTETANIQSVVSKSATQAVLMNHVNSDEFWFPGSSVFTPSGNTRILTV